jgi:ectoine hydroxylase-related dioxygenase (phytanoyl-CoA dioxygenase family)
MSTVAGAPTEDVEPFALTSQQVHFFETFGFLRLRGLLADGLADLIAAFEAVFADPRHEKYEMSESVHFDARRYIVPAILDKDPRLAALKSDPRIIGVARSLLGDDFEYAESDGNLLFCDTAWHCDIYDAPMERYHIKLFVYFDSLRGDNGGLRVIPGTNHYLTEFAAGLRTELQDWNAIRDKFGVEPEDIPSFVIENEPGDLIVGNFRTIHGTFRGGPRRRLCTLNFRQLDPS